MATTMEHLRSATREAEPGARPLGLSWGAIFGGVFAALAIWGMLFAFGLAIGLTVIDPGNVATLRGAGIFTGVWGILAPLIALFCGGLVAGQASGGIPRRARAVHGLVTWALASFVGALALGAFLMALVGGTLQAGAAAVAGADDVAEAVGVDAEAALAPINERLEAQGFPTMEAEQLEATAEDAARTAVQTGQLDRALIVESLADNTDLTAAQANEVAGEVEAQVQQGMSEARVVGAQMAEIGGRGFWALFAVLLIGMIASVGGALLGGGPRLRAWPAFSAEGPSPTKAGERETTPREEPSQPRPS